VACERGCFALRCEAGAKGKEGGTDDEAVRTCLWQWQQPARKPNVEQFTDAGTTHDALVAWAPPLFPLRWPVNGTEITCTRSLGGWASSPPSRGLGGLVLGAHLVCNLLGSSAGRLAAHHGQSSSQPPVHLCRGTDRLTDADAHSCFRAFAPLPIPLLAPDRLC